MSAKLLTATASAWLLLTLVGWPVETAGQTPAVTYAKALERPAAVATEIEQFLDGKGELDWRTLTAALDSAQAEVAAYRADHPDDLGGLILTARLGRIVELLRPAMIGGEHGQPLVPDTVDHMAPLHAALDRAVALEPHLGEAYYWKAKVAGTVRPSMVGEDMVLRADWPRAVEYATKAVELSPDRADYRILLATSLVQVGRFDQAREVLREVDQGSNLLFRILEDFARVPVPDSAHVWLAGSEVASDMFAGAPADLRAYGPARVRALVVPGTARSVEAFYQGRWPQFRLFSNAGDPGVLGQFLEPAGGTLAPARSAKALEGQEPPRQGIMMIVTERDSLPASERSRYPEALDPHAPVCEVLLINFRRK